MSAQILLISSIVIAAFATLALANPTGIISVDLKQALYKTVCPIREDVDVNPDRVPRVIKIMKCAQEQNWCEAQRIPRHECCQHHAHGGHQRRCMEMHDKVMVYYKSTEKAEEYEVPVGCSCVIEETTDAPLLPSGPT